MVGILLEASTELPMTSTSATVLGASILITVAWLLYLYR